MSKPLVPTLFDVSDEEGWKFHLNEQGYIVIKDILTVEQHAQGLELFKKDMQTVSPKYDGTSTTMNIDHLPLMFGKGMAVFNGFGQSDFMWSLRTNTKIQDIFKRVYEVEDLVTSLDGFSMFVSKAQKSKSWLHIDQNPKTKLYSIQGAYNYFPVKSCRDAGFVVVPKSHTEFTPTVSHSNNWIVCEDQKAQQEKSRKLLIPENCLVLWNSKTIHANEGMINGTTELNRLTCYVTFLPKSLRTEKMRKARVEAYLNGKTTSHWSNLCQLKRYPFGFKTRYENRGFNQIKPTLIYNSRETEETNPTKGIPVNRFNLL